MSGNSHRRHVFVAGFLFLSTACGSTAQISSTRRAEPGLEATAVGLGSPVGTPTTDTTGRVPTAVAGSTGTGQTNPVEARGTRLPAENAVNLPGVSKTTITIGVIAADPSTNQIMENAGLAAASVGNEPANWQAVADDVNAHGGIAGRRLALIFYLVNLTDSPQTQGQAACAKFTQDNTVAAVLSGYYYASAHVCLSQQRVPALLGTNYGVDSSLAKQSSTVVAWATPLLDRLAAGTEGRVPEQGQAEAGNDCGHLRNRRARLQA